MKGTIVVISPKNEKTITELERQPNVSVYQKAVGGYIETVPYFDTYEHNGEVKTCIVFCDEEGKLKGKDYNLPATMLWRLSLERCGRWIPGLLPDKDFLVGDIAIVFGDRDFMRRM